MAKGVAQHDRKKGLSKGEADENERRDKTENDYRRMNERPQNNYDWSRQHLNFEIKDGKIIPLGSQKDCLYDRYKKLLQDIGYKGYKAGASNEQNVYVSLILSGSTEKMQKLAFGSQKVDYERNPKEWHNWNVKRSTGENSIESWAMDSYNFVCEEYGKENIVGFEVHLDETAPHIHVNIVPTAIMQQRGNVSGYHKILMGDDGQPKLDKDGNTIPATYTKGKHVGEVIKISDQKYNTLSEEKKKEYRKNTRGTVRTISYATYFGSTGRQRSQALSELHTKYHNKVGIIYGLDRGDVIADLPEDERRKRRHKSKREAFEEKVLQLMKEKAIQEKNEAFRDRDAAVREKEEQNDNIRRNKVTLMEQGAELKRLEAERQGAVAAKDVAVQEAEKQKIVIQDNDTAIEQQKSTIFDNDTVLQNQKRSIRENSETIESGKTKLRYIEDDITSANAELAEIKEKIETEKKNLSAIEEEKDKARSDLDAMIAVKVYKENSIGERIKALPDVEFTVPADLLSRLKSPLRNHPRILSSNSPLTFEEVARIGQEEIDKVVNNIGMMTSRKTVLAQVRAIYTDVTTIQLYGAGREQKRAIIDANKELYKDVKKQLAKAARYDELANAGITRETYDEAVSQARRLPETERTLEFAWPGLTHAKDILTDPALDHKYMTDEQKNAILETLKDDTPEHRIKDIERVLDYSGSFRKIPESTKAEAIELATSSIIKTIAQQGYNLITEATAQIGSIAKDLEMSVAEAAETAASAAVCLIFGYIDGATTVSAGCGGGGGGGNDLPRKKDDEDDRRFFGRCLGVAIGLMKPKQQRTRGIGGRH
jgi:hypothetical protein